jgi:protein SCO1/2
MAVIEVSSGKGMHAGIEHGRWSRNDSFSSQDHEGTMTRTITKALLLILLLAVPAAVDSTAGQQDKDTGVIGVAEKTGQYVPLDLPFHDEQGQTALLGSFVTKPTILMFAYHSCTTICPQVLGGLATTLSKVNLSPGRDYSVVTISFDENDTPAVARQKKVNYITATGIPFPDDAWKFLTGSRESISRITEAAGFSFRRVPQGFIHPAVLIFLAPDGRITRYLYVGQSHYGTPSPVAFSPSEITTALTDASQGKIRPVTKSLIQLCFPNMSEKDALFYSILAVVGAVTLICMIAFFFYLKRPRR